MKSQGKIYGIMNLQTGYYFTGTDKEGTPEYSWFEHKAKRYSGYFVRRVVTTLKNLTGAKHKMERID